VEDRRENDQERHSDAVSDALDLKVYMVASIVSDDVGGGSPRHWRRR